jgi:tRNA G10  N-methylase Trm11
VDLIVTDPPYGVAWQSNRRNVQLDALVGDDGSLDVEAAIGLALKHLRRRRHLYCFGPLKTAGLPLSGITELVWDKEIVGPGNLSATWAPSHERVLFAVYEFSKANREDGAGNLAARLRRGTVVRVPRLHSVAVSLHPTQKPVRLLREFIESSSRFDEVVLDPFMGSGSTLVAAALEDRRSIGIEIEERYCEIAAKRLTEMSEAA